MIKKALPIIPFLQKVPIFSHVRLEDLATLSHSVKRVYALRKQILFKQGDPCDGFHVIVYGIIKMSLTTWNGIDKPMQLMKPGSCFGDITMFSGQPYFMDVQALEECFLIFIPRQAIVQLIDHDSQFAMQLLASLAERVRGLIGDIESFTLQPPAARLITYLMRLLPPHYNKTAILNLSINKNIVAAHLNMTPETLSRYFKELTDVGLVSVSGRTVTVHDVDGLERYLSGGGTPPGSQPKHDPAID